MSNYHIYNNFFSKAFVQKTLHKSQGLWDKQCIQRDFDISPEDSNLDIVKKIYAGLDKHHRNEYFFKNTLFNKLVLGKYSLRTTTALREVTIHKSKADFVLMNGKAVVFEIKTSLDTLDKLDTQIQDYYRAFTHVCVLTDSTHAQKIHDKYKNTKTGIYVLKKNNKISTIQEPQKCIDYLNYKSLFSLLRKSEYIHIIEHVFGKVPEAKPVFFYDECFQLFKHIKIEEAHELVISQLKKRNINTVQEYMQYVPRELSYAAYFSGLKSKDYELLHNYLEEKRG